MGNFGSWLVNRACEWSTWRGLATVAAAVGYGVQADAVLNVVSIFLGLAGTGDLLKREPVSPDSGTPIAKPKRLE
jgi:hypothetical protein